MKKDSKKARTHRETVLREPMKMGMIVRHFKRDLSHSNETKNQYLYRILCLAQHTDTDEILVIYKALYGAQKIYARPLQEFNSKVDIRKYSEAKQEYRFEPAKEDEYMEQGEEA